MIITPSYKTIAVTGSAGFIGRKVLAELSLRGFNTRAIVRNISQLKYFSDIVPDSFALVNICSNTDWSTTLTGVSCIIHCAARAHVITEYDTDSIAAYRKVNVEGSRRLAEQAAIAGVKRIVFLSSIGVNGVSTKFSQPFTSFDTAAPTEAYAISKMEAEQALWEVSAKYGMEIVVVRAPLVYGPGAKGNLARLIKFVQLGLPLPFGAIKNQRSLIGLDNLADLLICCVDHSNAAGETFLVSDDEDISTPDLLRYMAVQMGRSAHLFQVPLPLLRFAASAIGRRAELDRLIGSLQVDTSHTRKVLNWKPPVSIEEGIRRMVQGG